MERIKKTPSPCQNWRQKLRPRLLQKQPGALLISRKTFPENGKLSLVILLILRLFAHQFMTFASMQKGAMR